MTSLDDLLTRIKSLPADKQKAVADEAWKYAEDRRFRWVPSPGPQTDAYYSKADVLLYGGEPGGGKTQLLLGLAFNEHQRSLVMRRRYGDLDRIIEDMLKINGGRNGYNGSPPPKLKTTDGRTIDLGAAQHIGDEQNFMGRGHDALLIDEGTHFAEQQVRFLMGWVRTEVEGQRTRTVIATNPPLSAEGLWVVQMFAPWLDQKYPRPAKPGELRWVISDEDGKDQWVDGPAPVVVKDKLVEPKSRTYIPASVADNPYYANTNYQRELDAMPEPMRSILLGKFRSILRDAMNQVIPTDWIREAMTRWTNRPPSGAPMCAIGVDVAQGGEDETVLAIRYDGWYAPMERVPGKQTPFGSDVAGLVITKRRDRALVVIDLGGGYGGAAYEHLKANDVEVVGYKGAEKSTRRSRDGKLHFTNKRSAAYWAFREALDPGQPGGSPIMLPDDSVLLSDLTAPSFEPTPNGIKLESKEDLVARLGRSPDSGDAVVMAWFEGPKMVTSALEWADSVEHGLVRRGQRPKVIMDTRHHRR